jgi:hypothetical protein
MCTVTIAPHPDLKRGQAHTIRVVCNRDELRSRAIATPPTVERCGARQAILPRDPQAGGTWIAANDAGLVFVLLNATSCNDAPISNPTSRGSIIPGLLGSQSLEEAICLAKRMDVGHFYPFRLVLLNRLDVVELAREKSRLVVRERSSTGSPRLFTSSGLGDELVAAPRRALFREHFSTGADWHAQQDAFHRHRWPGREHVSVLMCRPDAQTVSRTEIELKNDRVLFSYYDLSEGEQDSPVSSELSLSKGRE